MILYYYYIIAILCILTTNFSSKFYANKFPEEDLKVETGRTI